jgi:hypothetical protein
MESVEMRMERVFHGSGKVREPTAKQFEIFVESHRA